MDQDRTGQPTFDSQAGGRSANYPELNLSDLTASRPQTAQPQPGRKGFMKRFVLGLIALGVMGGASAVGVVQALKAFNKQELAEPARLAVPLGSEAPKPIQLAANDFPASPSATNPFRHQEAATDSAGSYPYRGGSHARDELSREEAVTANSEPAASPQDDIPPAQSLDPAQAERAQEQADEVPVRGGNPFAKKTPSAADESRVVQAQATLPAASGSTDLDPAAEPARLGAAEQQPAPLSAAQQPARLGAVEQQATPSENDRSDFAPPRSQPDAPPPQNLDSNPLDTAVATQPPAETTQAAPGEGTGRPGSHELEGPQSPTLTIEKRAPAEIQVGKPATFIVKVRNVGRAAANGVQLHDEIPKGTQLVKTKPSASQTPDGKLVWELGTVKPGDEVQAEMELMPTEEGEIGSVAMVTFRAEASVRTVATRPVLSLKTSAPAKVMIGEPVMLKIKISNSGSGAARGVVLSEMVPAGLKHSAGPELEFDVGMLKPGESRELELSMTAAQAGRLVNVLTARGDGNIKTEDRLEMEVIAPALKVSLTGPKKRVLERKATWTVTVANPGTAAAKDIELVVALPKGMRFIEANNAGQYDSATHSVYWSLEELPAKETGSVTVTALPVEAGDQKLQIKGLAKQGLKDEHEETVVVEGVAAILFELVDVHDPVEVGGETSYEIRVINQGSKAATNIQLVALLPEQMKAVSADGPVRYAVDGQRVLFEPLKQLAPKADTTYSIKVQCLAAGDQRVQVKLASDDVRTPITKEESTRVYADE